MAKDVNHPNLLTTLGPINLGGVSSSGGDSVNHPDHYGGASSVYEAIKIIEAWKLNFNLGNALKYLVRANYKGKKVEDLKKAIWYIQREIDND
jgi:hypothetical protein